MQNTPFFTWNDIQQATGGTWLLPPAGDGASSVLDDSRKCSPGCLFVAVAGELTDGHKYLVQSAQAGAGAVCVQRPLTADERDSLSALGCGCLLVSNGLEAFQALARAHRRRFPSLPVLGVTGSCGKTSTKEMCAAVLNARWPGKVLKTIGNTNNHFGVPRNLLRISQDTCAAVIETGSNHPGEIASLCQMVAPTCAIISCIGAAHLEFFKDLDGVAEEKGDIFQALPDDGVAILPADSHGRDILERHAAPRRLITFGLSDHADIQAIYGGVSPQGYDLTLIRHDTGESISFSWSIGGQCQAGNAAGAAAVGLVYGMTLPQIAAGLQSCSLPGARMALVEADGVTWANDAYNANPSSMLASLDWFREISAKAPSRVIVLGDMRELGESASMAHRDVLQQALRLFPDDLVVTVGEIFAPHAQELGVRHYLDVDAARSALSFPAGSMVFVKASFGTGLYKLVPENAATPSRS